MILAQFVYGVNSNTPEYMIKDGKKYKIISDHLGSVRKVIDFDTKEVVQEIKYDSFGNVLEDSNADFQPFGYVGGLQDRETGYVNFGAREYDPKTGRWTSKEPLGFDGSMNFYNYCEGDPVNFVDVSGLDISGFDLTSNLAGESFGDKSISNSLIPIFDVISNVNLKRLILGVAKIFSLGFALKGGVDTKDFLFALDTFMSGLSDIFCSFDKDSKVGDFLSFMQISVALKYYGDYLHPMFGSSLKNIYIGSSILSSSKDLTTRGIQSTLDSGFNTGVAVYDILSNVKSSGRRFNIKPNFLKNPYPIEIITTRQY